ncbi:expressed unknown protein [Seminavis robusta]|uniref:Secreted protein n=1 Tax=Seminavis robusta TaxID=568900 RepID=A0A9N8DX48_9STRA|nr:expressed unknown protein [Seminavis robusta]|eukprot:Sro312_g114610.1 n/a (198) ;mRNA; f:40942-41628
MKIIILFPFLFVALFLGLPTVALEATAVGSAQTGTNDDGAFLGDGDVPNTIVDGNVIGGDPNDQVEAKSLEERLDVCEVKLHRFEQTTESAEASAEECTVRLAAALEDNKICALLTDAMAEDFTKDQLKKQRKLEETTLFLAAECDKKILQCEDKANACTTRLDHVMEYSAKMSKPSLEDLHVCEHQLHQLRRALER